MKWITFILIIIYLQYYQLFLAILNITTRIWSPIEYSTACARIGVRQYLCLPLSVFQGYSFSFFSVCKTFNYLWTSNYRTGDFDADVSVWVSFPRWHHFTNSLSSEISVEKVSFNFPGDGICLLNLAEWDKERNIPERNNEDQRIGADWHWPGLADDRLNVQWRGGSCEGCVVPPAYAQSCPAVILGVCQLWRRRITIVMYCIHGAHLTFRRRTAQFSSLSFFSLGVQYR
jgi:hypothetical protein